MEQQQAVCVHTDTTTMTEAITDTIKTECFIDTMTEGITVTHTTTASCIADTVMTEELEETTSTVGVTDTVTAQYVMDTTETKDVMATTPTEVDMNTTSTEVDMNTKKSECDMNTTSTECATDVIEAEVVMDAMIMMRCSRLSTDGCVMNITTEAVVNTCVVGLETRTGEAVLELPSDTVKESEDELIGATADEAVDRKYEVNVEECENEEAVCNDPCLIHGETRDGTEDAKEDGWTSEEILCGDEKEENMNEDRDRTEDEGLPTAPSCSLGCVVEQADNGSEMLTEKIEEADGDVEEDGNDEEDDSILRLDVSIIFSCLLFQIAFAFQKM